MLSGIIGNNLIQPGGGGADLGTLGNEIVATRPLDLQGFFLVDEDLATAQANPGLQDSSGNDRTLVPLNSGDSSFATYFNFQQGPVDNMLSFIETLSSRHAWSRAYTGFDFTSDAFTLLCFLNRGTGGAGTVMSFVDVDAAAVNRGTFYVRVFNTGAIQVAMANDAGSFQTRGSATGTPLLASTWHMLAVTFDTTNYRIYLDGVDVTSGSITPGTGTFSPDTFAYGATPYNVNSVANATASDLGPYAFWSAELNTTELGDIFTASGL